MLVDGEQVARWVSVQLGYALCPPYYAIGTERDGEIVNGVIFCGFEAYDVQVTAAGSGWSLPLVRALHGYVFDQLGCLRATFLTEKPKVVDYVVRLGGEVEGCLRNHFGEGRNATVIGLLREHAKFYTLPVNKRG